MEEMEGGREVDEGQGRRKGGGVSVVGVGEKGNWEQGGETGMGTRRYKRSCKNRTK